MQGKYWYASLGLMIACSSGPTKTVEEIQEDSLMASLWTDSIVATDIIAIPEFPHTLHKSATVSELCSRYDSIQRSADSNEPYFYYANPYTLRAEDYSALDFKEKWIYAILHPESYSQICSFLYFATLEEQNSIFGKIRSDYGELHLSKRQDSLFIDHPEKCIALFNEDLLSKKHLSNRGLEVIYHYNYTDCIPAIIQAYLTTGSRNTFQLSCLMQLMVKGKYSPFMESELYHSIYEGKSSIPHNKANAETIIGYARAYADSLKKLLNQSIPDESTAL